MTLLFVRHGESLANTLRIVSNRDFPHPLTALGTQRAEQLAGELKDRQISKIYSSPILRAKQTAEILARRLSLIVEVADGLREYDCGDLEGFGDEETWKRHSEVINAWLYNQDFDVRSPGGESFHDIERRFVPFIDYLRGRHDDGETILLVGHGGTYRAMLPIVCENISYEFIQTAPMNNSIVIETVWTPTGLVCLNWDGASI